MKLLISNIQKFDAEVIFFRSLEVRRNKKINSELYSDLESNINKNNI